MISRASGIVVLAVAALACAPAAEAPSDSAESVFFLVRHAEKADESEDPPLTEEGRLRAAALAATLRDAGIERIYSSDFERNRETAAPLADRLGLELILYDPDALPDLAETLLKSPGRSLVVGHSDTTPELAALLGGEGGPSIGRDEYDRLYVICRRPGGDASTVLLRFGPLQGHPRQEGVEALDAASSGPS